MADQQLCMIGAGTHALANIYPAAQLAGAEFAAVCTRHEASARRALVQFGSGGRAYTDVAALLAGESCRNMVVVAQPADAPALVEQCLRAGCNVLCEKPLGLDPAQAQQLAAAQQAGGGVLMVAFMKRFAPVYRQLKALITGGELGPVRAFSACFAVDASAWCTQPKWFVYQVVIHYLDLIRHLFGEVEALCGFASDQGAAGLSQCFSVRCAGGAVGTVRFENRSAWSREYEALDVTFQNGFARSEDTTRLTVHRAAAQQAAPWRALSECDEVWLPNAAPMSGTTRDLYLRGFVGELEHYLHCCRTGARPLTDGADNLRTAQLCQRVLDELA